MYEQICAISNLELADEIASRGKAKQYGVINHLKNQNMNLLALQNMLLDKTYVTSTYDVFKVYEPKERTVYRLPYFPDRIAHHGIMNILEPIWVSVFTADTYSCIKGRGIHKAQRNLKRALNDVKGTQYCLKLDIVKFYPSVDHDILKSIIRRKIKDTDLLWLLDGIIDSAPGLPIGNYLSQYMANLYLAYFDHWLKEQKGVKYYFRYADDLVILSADKPSLHRLLAEIRHYLKENLKLDVKPNYQVFPVDKRGIDFVGYRFWHTHILLRKSIKKRFARMLATRPNNASVAAYSGWVKHCDGKHLVKKLNDQFQRPEHKTRNESVRGQKDEHHRHSQRGDNRPRIQSRKQQNKTRARQEVPSPIIRT